MKIAYWVLIVSQLNGTADQIPKALGPYPSLSLCQSAVHYVIPDDARFWGPIDRAERLKDAEAGSYKREPLRPITVGRLLRSVGLFVFGFLWSLKGWLHLDDKRRLICAAWIGSGLLLSASAYGILFGFWL